jgi:hypothetical protein
LAQFRALVLKRLDQAGAFGLVRAELPMVPSTVSTDYVGVEKSVVEPVSEFTLGESRGSAEFDAGHDGNQSYNAIGSAPPT